MRRRSTVSRRSRGRKIFIPAVGQLDNIGDVILRRPLLSWARDQGELHVYVGHASQGYLDGLRMAGSDKIYRAFIPWLIAGLRAAMRGRAVYIFKPGEIQLTLPGLKEHVGVIPLIALIRLRRGTVMRIGAGARNASAVPRLLMEPSLRLSQLNVWRDERTRESMRRGSVEPDLAFGERSEEPPNNLARHRLTVSMRSDRPALPQHALNALVRFAAQRGLVLTVVTQVHRDRASNAHLALRLSAELFDWDGQSHRQHEEQLRQVFRESQLVVSDRLHVLIAAVTEGSTPCALLSYEGGKIRRHFEVIDLTDIEVPVSDSSESQVTAALERAAQRGPRTRTALDEARGRLAKLKGVFEQALAEADGQMNDSQSGGRNTMYHVGRRGEVPGGMSQVVNAQIGWTFQGTDTGFIASRSGKSFVHDVGLLATALTRIGWLSRDDSNGLVVHLSQRGSFIREGVCLLLGWRLGMATVAQLHGSNFEEFAVRNRKIVKLILSRADVVLTLSQSTSAVVQQLLPSASVQFIPNGVVSAETVEDKLPIAFFAGSVSTRKGVDTLLEAWDLAGSGKGWELVLAGPMQDELPVASVADVRYLGVLEHGDVLKMLSQSSLAVLPSRNEAMPLFILEAMARRNCIISTKVGGIPELLAEGAGILIEPGDVAALASAIGQTMDNVELREVLAQTALARFDASFSANAVFPRLEKAWDRGIAKARSRRSAGKS